MTAPGITGVTRTITTRRQFFGSLAAGSAAGALSAVALTVSVQAQDGKSLGALIQRHRNAETVWGDAYDAFTRGECTQEQSQVADDAEKAALRALLEYRPGSMEEVAARLKYLLGPDDPWDGMVPNEWELDCLFTSMGASRTL